MSSPYAERAAAALAVPLQHALQARLVDPTNPAGGVTFPVTGLAATPAGTLHAAALSAVLELSGFLAVLPGLEPDQHAVTHHIATQYCAPGHAGEWVQVTATVAHRARRLAFVSATATVEDRLLATAQITKSVIEA